MINHAVYVTENRQMIYKPAPVPDVRDDDVLINMKVCGICGSDVHFYEHGEPEFPDVYPFILGHEGAGQVVKVGRAVKNLSVGDRVAIEPGTPCRQCEWCVTGRYNLCSNMIFKSAPREHGIMREFVAHPAQMCYKLPDNMSFEEGALIEPLAVAMTAVRTVDAKIGQTAAILGSGCIGLVTLLALKSIGITKITMVDLFDIRLNKAKDLGAWKTVNAKEVDPVAEVIKIFDGIGPDLVFETAGSIKAASQTIKMVKRGGTVMIIGNVVGQTPIDFQMMTNKEITIKTNFRYHNIYPQTIEAVSSGRVDLSKIVSRRYPLLNTRDAFEDSINEKASMVKAVLNFEA